MDQHLSFERLNQYDPGQPGITLDISLRLSATIVNFPANVDTGRAIAFSNAVTARRLDLASKATCHSRSAQ
jgi:hypothetical protein